MDDADDDLGMIVDFKVTAMEVDEDDPTEFMVPCGKPGPLYRTMR